MSHVIGIVSEGPTDYLMLTKVIDKITGEDNTYLRSAYYAFSEYVADNWNKVTSKCSSARLLDEEIRKAAGLKCPDY